MCVTNLWLATSKMPGDEHFALDGSSPCASSAIEPVPGHRSNFVGSTSSVASIAHTMPVLSGVAEATSQSSSGELHAHRSDDAQYAAGRHRFGSADIGASMQGGPPSMHCLPFWIGL